MSDSKKVTIDRGEDKPFSIFLLDASGRPYDLTSYDKFSLALPSTAEGEPLLLTETANGNGSIVNKATPNVLGKIDVVINRLDTANLKPGFGLDCYLQIENSGASVRKRVKIPALLDVEETPLPA